MTYMKNIYMHISNVDDNVIQVYMVLLLSVRSSEARASRGHFFFVSRLCGVVGSVPVSTLKLNGYGLH